MEAKAGRGQVDQLVGTVVTGSTEESRNAAGAVHVIEKQSFSRGSSQSSGSGRAELRDLEADVWQVTGEGVVESVSSVLGPAGRGGETFPKELSALGQKQDRFLKP